MHFPKLAIYTLFFYFSSHAASAEMYRCAAPNGAITYQDKPCAEGVQKIVASPATGPSTAPQTDFEIARQRAEDDMKKAYREAKLQEQKNKEEAKRFDAEWPAQKKAMEKAAGDAVAKFQVDEKQKLADLHKCAHRDIEAGCSAIAYRRMLRAMRRFDVETILGAGKTQLIGERELVYFSISILDGKTWRTGRLQLQFGYDPSVPAGVIGRADRVTELNIY